VTKIVSEAAVSLCLEPRRERDGIAARRALAAACRCLPLLLLLLLRAHVANVSLTPFAHQQTKTGGAYS
jgi:hypothetical protein